jgi:hypothetical protein
MRPLSESELLDVWEQAYPKTATARAVSLVAAAMDAPLDEAARLSLGERDARLLALREWSFGAEMTGVATCPECGEEVELNLGTADLHAPAGGNRAEALATIADGYDIHFRLPNSLDTDLASRAANVASARRLLLERCLTGASRDGQDVSLDDLPLTAIAAVESSMEEADPLANVQLALTCAACGRQWREAFDIAGFFWKELDGWAERMLREIHALATAYHWRESDILALSPTRRRVYLELVGG